jgi:hypothetical protein
MPPSIEIISPTNDRNFDITTGSMATGPQMPSFSAEARILGITPDPTPTTQFTWTVEIKFQTSDCQPNVRRPVTINDQFELLSVGGRINIAFPRVRGGQLTLTVSTVLPTGKIEAMTSGLRIRGINPMRAELNGALPTLTLQRIAAHESTQRQFRADRNGGIGNCPLMSADRAGGVGLFQITNPAPTEDEHWDWLANIRRGIAIFNEKQRIARNYPAQVRRSQGFGDLVRRYNLANPPTADSPTISVDLLPDFDANQLELDSIRGYNGWAGRDLFRLPLHEFRVPVDPDGNLVVNTDMTTGIQSIVWERVPAADRPQNTGDPNYVDHVLAQIP